MRTNLNIEGLKDSVPANLPADLLCGHGGQVWTALAELGRQLQILAGAQTAQGNFSAQASFPPRQMDSPTVVELANQFMLAKARADKSERYLRAIRGSLKRFVSGRAHKFCCDVTVQEVEDWMNNLDVGARTQRGYVSDIRTLFNFGIRRGLIKSNPANGVELPVEPSSEILIHTPAEARTVLNFARQYDPHIFRALAVRYFAGLRTAEVERIGEDDIKGEFLEVSAANAKTRRRRLVTIQPVLRAWLALGGELPAQNSNGRRMLEFMRALTASGVNWPANATRHSFCSYHLAKFQNASKTALECGHSEAMLFAHYRAIVLPAEAEEFFGILPEKLGI